MSYDPNDAKSIFLHAAELPSATERAAFLEKTCAGKPELKARVESLLKTALDPDSLLDQPVAEFGATQMVPHDASPESLDFLKASNAAGSLGRLGGYEILEVIGRGGMGVVLRAMDSKLNRVVAIKVLAPELASQPQARKRFLREAQAAAAVSHDHVVTIHAVDDDEKVPLLVMECIVGQSLQQKIDKVGALGLKEILRIGMQIASGLAAAHKQGLVHRDIKPANILLENGVERVKITDFGLARATDDVGITQSGQIAGTPQYMSPEQAQGHPVDQRSDLFSLGSVLYTMCAGRPAFRADSAVAVLRRVCDDTPRPIGEVNAEVPAWLIAIVNRLMAKKAEDRFQTAQEVTGLLEKWLAHCQQPATAPRPSMPEPVTPVETLSTTAAQPEEESSLGTFETSVLTLFFIAAAGIFVAEITGYLGAERRSFTMTYLVATLMGFLLIAKLVRAAFNWLREPVITRSSQEPPSESRFNNPASTTPPRGTLSRAWDEWWSERDRWITISVQTVLILVYLVCMICFVSMGGSGGQDAEGHVTFGYRLGVPDPWFQFEVYPQPNRPFRTLFNLWSSSVLIGLVGCAAYFIFWQIEKARDPKTSKWNGPAFMLGIWGVGALLAVGFGHWQGYAALNKPRVAVTSPITPVITTLPPGTLVLPTPDGKPFDWKESAAKVGVAAPPSAIAPFDTEQAKKHQEAWAKHLKLEVERTNMLGMKLSLIPPGKFQMGSTPEELAQLKQELELSGAPDFDKFVAQSSGPRHVVELSQPFYMSQHEVTVAQFRQFVEETSYQPSAERAGNAQFTWKSFVPEADAAEQPVCGVSWEDANAFCQWLTGKSSTDQNKQVYDLPTEAQWEYSCRAGSQSLWSSGDDAVALSEYAVVGQKGTPHPASVELRRANAFGLFDMHGNVDEWCLDWHNHGFYGRSPLVDPAYLDAPKDAASGRVARGGAWNADAWWSRSATRTYDFPTSPTFAKGFRVVGKLSP